MKAYALSGWCFRCWLLLLGVTLFSQGAFAEVQSDAIYETVLDAYQSKAGAWASVITARATWLYWTLVLISMIWTFGLMALRKADIGEFFTELLKFTIATGFFWWLLTNGPQFSSDIIKSMRMIGAQATGSSGEIQPGNVSQIGFDVFFRILDSISVTSPGTAIAAVALGLGILLVVSLIAVNMLILLCCGWILAYAGVFFLGFGGSRWTSDIAINYYKTVLGVATQLMAMVLLVGIGSSIMQGYYDRLAAGLQLKEVAVLFVVAIILYQLVERVPTMLSGIITGASIHGMGGGFGAGMAAGAMGMAGAAVAAGGAMMGAAAQNTVGAGAALKASFDLAKSHMETGGGLFQGLAAAAGGEGGGAFSAAMGSGAAFVADMSANLAKGVAAVAKDSMQEMKDNFMHGEDANQAGAGEALGGVDATVGGRVANSIKETGEAEAAALSEGFAGDSIGGDEVSNFVNKADGGEA